MTSTRTDRGFTVIELLIVVAIIGILAAIAIPNLITAINRAKQKRTISDIRNIATAWEAHALDANSYTASAATFPWPVSPISQGELESLLIPHYVKKIPVLDGWGTAYQFGSDQPFGSYGQGYAIRSAGWDQQFDGDSYQYGLASDFECDIVYANGAFVSYPQSAMKN